MREAARVYRRPLGVFFLPEPPQDDGTFLQCRACRSTANVPEDTLNLRIPYARFGKPSDISGMR